MVASKKPLSAAFVNSVKEPGKYHDCKGTGLFLLVKQTGRRSWVQRLSIRGTRRDIGLGALAFVTLAEAREKALENKRLVLKGRDPLAEKIRANEIPTFETAARRAHSELSPTWKNPKDQKAFLSTLETYVFCRFGAVPLPDVTSADVRQAILTAREKAPGVARKLVYRVSAVFKWGIAEGHCVNNPATTQALALPRETRAVQHRKSLPYFEVSGCLETVKTSGALPVTKLALEFIVLTACRSGEVRLARWNEFDLDPSGKANCATWAIPAERSKSGRPHMVPLSSRATAIILEARALEDGTGLVFPSLRGKPLSEMTLPKLVKELGFDADVHGFRTSFRTWGQEQTNYPREVQESALGHKVGDAAEQAYARSDYFEKRKEMMEDWASYLAKNSTPPYRARSQTP